jgi:hypothetical protein
MSLTNEFLEQMKHGAPRNTGYITISEIYAFLQQVKHGICKISLNFVESDIIMSRNLERQTYEEDI